MPWHSASEWVSGWHWCSLCFHCSGLRRISPLAALRRPYEPGPGSLDRWVVVALLLVAGSTVALAAYQVGSWRQGAIFAAAVAVALLTLWAAAWTLTRFMRRWLPQGWPYVWRQGLANLHRPANQTVTSGAGYRLRSLPAGHPVPGSAQLAAPAQRERRTGPAKPGALRHTAGSARTGRADAARGWPPAHRAHADRAHADQLGEGPAGH